MVPRVGRDLKSSRVAGERLPVGGGQVGDGSTEAMATLTMARRWPCLTVALACLWRWPDGGDP